MENSNSTPLWKQILVVVLLLVATVMGIQTISSLWSGGVVATAMPPEELRSVIQNSEANDRENWNKMWKKSGRKPPP
ncbi:MAG: hypothetical protein V4719_01815 [Planctomycetota bacterium]